MNTLHLVRHGHTLWNDTGGVAGRTDIALSDRGREAVDALRPSLQALLDGLARPPVWVCSSLQRTAETANRLADGATVMRDARLVELDFGDWEGSTWEAVHRDHEAQLADWGEDWVDGAPPNGESFRQQIARCADWLEGVQAGSAETVIAVSHGGSIRALLSLLLGHAPRDAMRFRIDPAHVCRIDREGRGWRLRASNLAGFVAAGE